MRLARTVENSVRSSLVHEGQDREQRGAPNGILSVVLVMLTASCAGAPTFPQYATAIPVPRPVSTAPYQVGAYYFPGWPTLDK